MCGRGIAGYFDGQRQAEVFGNRARVAKWQARDARERGAEKVRVFQKNVGRLLGTQRTGFAAKNIALDTGVAADVAADTQRTASLDATRISLNASREAWFFSQQKQSFKYAAQVAKNKGKQELIFGTLSDIAQIASFATGAGAGGSSAKSSVNVGSSGGAQGATQGPGVSPFSNFRQQAIGF